MFGLSRKAPSADAQREYVRQATFVVQTCLYLFQHHACPPVDGNAKYDLDDEENRKALGKAIGKRLKSLMPAIADPSSKMQAVIDMVASDSRLRHQLHQSEQDAGLVVMVIAGMDMIARHYYELYPKYQPMLEMVNNLAKIGPNGLRIVFGDDLPTEVREQFNYAARLWDDNRAAYGW